MVGAFLWPAWPWMPTEVGRPSVKARSGLWQLAQATVPSADNRPSKNNFLPNAIFSDVCGLSGGMAARVRATGKPTWSEDLGAASGPSLGIGGWLAAASCFCLLHPIEARTSNPTMQVKTVAKIFSRSMRSTGRIIARWRFKDLATTKRQCAAADTARKAEMFLLCEQGTIASRRLPCASGAVLVGSNALDLYNANNLERWRRNSFPPPQTRPSVELRFQRSLWHRSFGAKPTNRAGEADSSVRNRMWHAPTAHSILGLGATPRILMAKRRKCDSLRWIPASASLP